MQRGGVDRHPSAHTVQASLHGQFCDSQTSTLLRLDTRHSMHNMVCVGAPICNDAQDEAITMICDHASVPHGMVEQHAQRVEGPRSPAMMARTMCYKLG